MRYSFLPFQVMKKTLLLLFLTLSSCAQQDMQELLEQINLPEGYKIELYAQGVINARMMCRGDNGTIFVGSRREGSVYALRDNDQDFVAESVQNVACDLYMPNGVAFRDGNLYVAEVNKVWRYDNIEKALPEIPEPVLITDKLPSDGHHGWKFIRFGPDGKLYVPIGAPCNICLKEEPVYASICRMNPDGSDFEVYAHGVRNTVGFDWHPSTGELYFGDNGRDWMGDDMPPCELNRATKIGQHFGYPWCHGGKYLDDEITGRACDEFTAPAQNLGAHVAPVGMRFYTGTMLPKETHNQIILCEHGSWNREQKVGYRLVLLSLNNKGEVVSYKPFIDGWLQNENSIGRPADIEVLPDGSLLISDDLNGVIYRVSRK